MEKFVIEGGYPLSGTIAAAGNKNAALPALAAAWRTALPPGPGSFLAGSAPRRRMDTQAVLSPAPAAESTVILTFHPTREEA